MMALTSLTHGTSNTYGGFTRKTIRRYFNLRLPRSTMWLTLLLKGLAFMDRYVSYLYSVRSIIL